VQFRSQRIHTTSQGLSGDMAMAAGARVRRISRKRFLAGASAEEQKKIVNPDGWNE